VLLLVASACRQEPAPEGTPSPEETGIQSVADLGEGHVVGVQSGTTGEIWAKENLEPKGVELRAFPEGPDAYAALEACQVDGAVNDEVTAVFEAEERPDLEVVEAMKTDEVYGIAVNPENQALLDAVNVALRDIVEDGTYEQFFSKYPLLVEQLERASILDEFTSTATADEPPQFTTLKSGVLKVGSDIPYLPFEFREGGKLVGFEIDLINEIAKRLGVRTEVVDTGFDTIFTQLAAGRFDVVVAASTITPEREKEVNFSDGYFKANQSLTVNPTC
jgi:ABC-type amino acid transport substrate-binding protein